MLMEKILFSIGKTLYFHAQPADSPLKGKKTRFAWADRLAQHLGTGKIAGFIFSKVTPK